MARNLVASAVLASMLFLAGCSGTVDQPTYECKGKVTYNGNPVGVANIFFVAPGGKTIAGSTNEQGEYTISAVEGANTVRVSKLQVSANAPGAGPGGVSMPGSGGGDALKDITPEKMAEQMKNMQPGATGANPPPAESKGDAPKNELPARYGTDQSELKAEVTKDPTKNVFDFDLKD